MSEDHVGLSSRKLVNCLIRWNSWLNSKVVSSPERKEKTTQTSEKFLSFTVIYTLYWSATGKCKIWHFVLNNFYIRTWPSAQVFCVSSFYPASFSCSTLDLHFNGNHVYIISPNLWKALLGWSQIAKPHMAPQGLPRAVEHLPTSIFLQDSYNMGPPNLNTCRPLQLVRDGFQAFGSHFFVLRGLYIDCFVQIHFLLKGWSNLTLLRGLSSRKNLIGKLLMTNHMGHMTYHWFDFQYMLMNLQDYVT